MKLTYKILLFSGLSVLFFILLSYRIVNYIKLEKVEGTVISIGKADLSNMYRRQSESASHQFPVISYKVEGQELFYIKQTEVLFEKFDIGEKVSLLYYNNNPSKVYMNSILGFWITVPYLIIFVLLGILWIGLIYVIFDSNENMRTT